MAKHGQLEAITTHEDMILDGRNRFRVCLNLGMTPKFEAWDGHGGSPLIYVIGRNLHRRNLTTSQLAVIAVEVKARLEVEGKERMQNGGKKSGETRRNGKKEGLTNLSNLPSGPEPLDSTQQAADMMGVSRTNVVKAAAVRKADPALADRVRSGEITVHKARQQIKETKAAIAEVSPPKPRATKPKDHDGNVTRIAFNPGDPVGNVRACVKYLTREHWVEFSAELTRWLGV